MLQNHLERTFNVFALNATKQLDITRFTKSTMNTVVTSSYCVIYPDMMGKRIRANDPEDANHPCSVPCGLLPTTKFKKKYSVKPELK